jgi:hypothetical protein
MANTQPMNTDTVRPFRIWDAKKKANVPHRCYATERAAMISALILTRWAKVGETLEVHDISTGRLIGQYTRRVSSISFAK